MKAHSISWSTKGAVALADQVVSAGTVLGVNVAMARLVSVDDYGRFALLYAAVVFLNLMHNAFVTEPLLVMRHEFEGEALAAFDESLLWVHRMFVVGSVALGLTVSLSLWAIGHPEWSVDAAAVGVVVAASSYLWFVRRLWYQFGMGARALRISSANAAVMGSLLFACVQARLTDYRIGLMLFGISAAIVALPRFGRWSAGAAPGLLRFDPQVVRTFWEYGRWSSAGSTVNWGGGYAFYIILPLFVGFEASGLYRALMNIFLPFQHFILGLSNLVLTPLARVLGQSRSPSNWAILRSVVALVVVGIGYSAMIATWQTPLLALLYGGRYAETGQLVAAGVFLPPIWAIVISCVIVLRAIKLPRVVFIGYACGLVILLPLVRSLWILPANAPSAGAWAATYHYAMMQGVIGTALVAMLFAILSQQRSVATVARLGG